MRRIYIGNPYSNAINVQGAVNVLGITKSLAADIQVIADDLNAKGLMSSDKLAQHPVMRMYLEQLVYLCTGTTIPDGRPSTDYFSAAEACRQMAPIIDASLFFPLTIVIDPRDSQVHAAGPARTVCGMPLSDSYNFPPLMTVKNLTCGACERETGLMLAQPRNVVITEEGQDDDSK
jgi:hypothetical protein